MTNLDRKYWGGKRVPPSLIFNILTREGKRNCPAPRVSARAMGTARTVSMRNLDSR